MTDATENYPQQFTRSVHIDTSPEAVWEVITQPAQIKKWMAETPLDIDTTWEPGSPITISGPWYKTQFENKGKVLCFDPPSRLSYTHLSSLSRLADDTENQTIYDFTLTSKDGTGTELTFTAKQFATSAIYHHLAFYWTVVIHKIKAVAEGT